MNDLILPGIRTEIEALKKRQRLHEQEKPEDVFFGNALSPCYVPAGAAINNCKK